MANTSQDHTGEESVRANAAEEWTTKEAEGMRRLSPQFPPVNHKEAVQHYLSPAGERNETISMKSAQDKSY